MKNIPAKVEMYTGSTPDKTLSQFFPEHGRTWPYKEEMRHFVDAVKNNLPFRAPASDAVHDVRVLEDIYKKHLEALGAD